MPRRIAFLRAINVGGHVVTMAALRGHFEALGLEQVETFINSGNVIFSTKAKDAKNDAALERKIEARLEKALGYEVKTFLRSEAELAAIARYQPFDAARIAAAPTFCVGFLAAPLDAAAQKLLAEMKTDADDFHLNGREMYWLSTRKQSESKFSNARFERTLKISSTFRGVNTITRLAEKYSLL
ncbi:MAG TPA: DUF1697 domain-containing protein [Candidatus Acidoferrales bacterium]|nr:DUF1697 domain-containing protein [Candidatus Acidoferrales bacterium]